MDQLCLITVVGQLISAARFESEERFIHPKETRVGVLGLVANIRKVDKANTLIKGLLFI